MMDQLDSSKWLVRALQPVDYDDIVDISKDVWEGYDYLPKVFFEWLDAPGLFLGLEDVEKHKIVSVGKYSYLFDGTGWLEGLRVHSAYRNQGISKIITKILFEKALQDLQSCKILRIANCTHATNEISIHLSLSNGFKIQQRYLVVEVEKQADPIHYSVSPWQPSFLEVREQRCFQKSNGYICQSFLVQSINQPWFDDLKQRAHFAIVDGSPGWVDLAIEPYVQICDPTPKSVVSWLHYGLEIIQKDNCLTFLYPEAELIEGLKSQPIKTWMNFEPDCLYLVYNP